MDNYDSPTVFNIISVGVLATLYTPWCCFQLGVHATRRSASSNQKVTPQAKQQVSGTVLSSARSSLDLLNPHPALLPEAPGICVLTSSPGGLVALSVSALKLFRCFNYCCPQTGVRVGFTGGVSGALDMRRGQNIPDMPILAETVHKNRVKPAGDTLRNDSYMDGPVFCPQVRFVIA